jgi:hypothetical protein
MTRVRACRSGNEIIFRGARFNLDPAATPDSAGFELCRHDAGAPNQQAPFARQHKRLVEASSRADDPARFPDGLVALAL